MNKHDWTVQDAIADRVRQEDLLDWAAKPNPEEPLEVMSKQLPSQKWSPTSRYVFGVLLILPFCVR
jgi:hypothetical protein